MATGEHQEPALPRQEAGLLLDQPARPDPEEPTASARHYQLLFDTMLQGVVYQDATGTIISMNPAAERILGKSRAELMGETSVSVEHHCIHEDGSRFPGLEHPSMVALRGGREQRGVTMGVFNPREQRYRWISISAVPLFRPGETKPYQVYTLFDDITDRKRTEEALRLRAHVTNTPLAVVEWDARFRVMSFSPRAEALFGWTAGEIVGKRLDEIPWIIQEDWPAVRAVMRDLAAGVRPAGVNANRNRRRDGSIIHCEWYNSALHDADGKLLSVLSLVLDVTERERAEEAVRASEEKLRLAQEAAGIGSWHWDLETDEVVMSDRCRELFGHALGTALIRDSCLAAVHPDDRERNERVVNEALASGKDYEIELRVPLPDGTVRWVSARGRGVYDAGGKPVRLTGMTLDITERRRAEEVLREADRLKTEFLGVLSHELRNPLAPIRNSIFLLDRAPAGSEQAARAKAVIRRQTEHLTRLVDDLLDVTRISRGKIELELERVDLREVVARTCDDHRTLFEGRRIELRIELSGPACIDADGTRIAQVVGNLLQNAAKFSREGGTVWVGVGAAEGQAEIRVRDDGIGIPPELLPRVFEPFVQAEEGLARTKGGLGLGLALVKGVVELHGGTVSASSEGVGRGSEFVVALPLAPATRASPPAPAAPLAFHPVEVLIIEDNVDAALTIAEVLRLEGHRVHVATDGASGIAKARALRPEVILCDIGLPDVDGYEVARELRADEALRSTRLIALSGYAQPEDRERAREAGFEAYLGKPAPLDRLSELVMRSR